MPQAFPAEFRRDVVAVARRGEASLAQVAKDFGISQSCVQRWVKAAEVDDGVRPRTTTSSAPAEADSAEVRELRKRNRLWNRRTRSCAARRPTCPGTCSQNDVPAGQRPASRRGPRRADLPGARLFQAIDRQAYYKWRANPLPARDWDEAHLINAARNAHADDPAFGYRFIADEIRDDLAAAGISAGENRVARLCSQERIWSVFAKKRGLNRKAGPPVHDDLVDRNFTAQAPNQLWLTDITEHPTGEGKVYACVIKDVFSNRIVGYSIDSRMKASLAVDALRAALARRAPGGAVVVHSDRGSQFRSRAFVRELNAAGLVGSMGRVGACGDNAAMESFFALLQRNVLDRQRWSTRQELRLAIVTWIERTYHRRRRQRGLGRLTPVEFETVYGLTLAA